MSHLSIERLAALVDEQPTADEHSHLFICADCARELDAHRSLHAMAGTERDSMGLPLTRWENLSKQLRAEGLIVSGGKGSEATPAGSTPHWVLRIAAALLLVAGGAMLGRFSAGASPLPGDESSQTASQVVPGDSFPTFASVENANRWKNFYRDGYQRAVSFLAQNDSAGQRTETPAVMRTRLSALDRVSRITREALNAAPNDPVINDFYLNAFGQREATLRELNTVLPQNVRMNSF